MTIVDGTYKVCIHVGSKLIEKILLNISPDCLNRVIIGKTSSCYGEVVFGEIILLRSVGSIMGQKKCSSVN